MEGVFMLSVNTNSNALIALQNLNATSGSLSRVQNEINTGLAVSSAKDNGAIFAIAQNMRGNVAAYQSVTQSLQRASSTVDVANSAGQSISDLLIQMKQKALSASDSSLDTASRTAMNSDFTALRDQITSIVNNATFNGVNLVNGSTASITALASADGTRRITVAAQNLKLSGSIVTVKSTGTISTQAKASAMVATITASLSNVDAALGKFGSGSAKYSVQQSFVQTLSDSLTTGIGNLVDADMATASAQLQALQVKQQLGVQALAIANQSPQILLSLFH
jgi:flagellin